MEGGDDEPFDSLVIATGFEYERPAIPGIDLDGIYYVRDIRAAKRWDEILDTVKSRGRRRGAADRRGDGDRTGPPRHRDAPGRPAPVGHGRDRRPGHHGTGGGLVARDGRASSTSTRAIKAFLGTERVHAVKTSDGEIPVDMVVIGAKKLPNNHLAAQAGIKLGSTGGIIVDEHMRTSAPGRVRRRRLRRGATGDAPESRSRACPAATPTPRARSPAAARAASCAATSRSTCRGAWSAASG